MDDDAAVLPPHPLRQGRIAVYGGSIDQGACASRPGMAYTNILSRWMNTEFVNWGFSGSGKAEAEVAKALSEIDDVRLFVINTAGNCPSASYLRAHLPAFLDLSLIHISSRPDTSGYSAWHAENRCGCRVR